MPSVTTILVVAPVLLLTAATVLGLAAAISLPSWSLL